MLKLSTKCCISAFKCTRFESNYSSCKGRRNENLCNNSGGAQGKKKDKVKLRKPSKFPEFQPPLDHVCLLRILGWNKQISLVPFLTKEKLGSAICLGNHQSNPSLAKTIN
jgi:hypothetical protein